MARKMSYNDAVSIVLEMRKKTGTMPTKKDYDKLSHMVDIKDLVDALGVKKDMKRLKIRAYAAVNIEVLRELRRRNGANPKITEGSWRSNSTITRKIFDGMFTEADNI